MLFRSTATGLATSCTATRTAWYQDARGWALRAALVNKYRIAGITAWTLGMQEPLATETIRKVAKEIAPDQVVVTAAIDKTTLDYGNPMVITANFAIKDKSPVVGAPVLIQGKSATDTNWRTLATATTDANGRIEKALFVGKSTTVRIFTEATWERTEGASSEYAVTINRTMTLTAPGSLRAGDEMVISGSIRPRSEGAIVTIEKLVGKEWKPLEKTAVTDAQGNFTAVIPGQSRGVLTLRASVAPDQLWAVITSPTFNIIIR